jgi:hypothetical protein
LTKTLVVVQKAIKENRRSLFCGAGETPAPQEDASFAVGVAGQIS